MNYISINFVFFVLASLILYYIIPKKVRWVVLLVASMYFYYSYDSRFFIFLFFSIITTYFSAIALSKIDTPLHKKSILLICIGANALIWFVVKDANWIIEFINRKQLFHSELSTFNLLVPIGISYYLLQSIGYLIDVYKKRITPEINIFKYTLFITWFPAIVQGPISRYSQLSKQLFKEHTFDFDNFIENLLLLLFGLIKKMVIADVLAVFVNYCFANTADLAGFTLYLGAIAYSFQLYFDFSGCVDICRGVSGLFDVHLIQNFKMPYFSKSIKEFWSRWHISLSSWLKDYIYIPLGGNRKGKVRKYLNLLITFLISGIWHGAGSGFIIWGLIHAIYQITGEVFERFRKYIKNIFGIKENSKSEAIYQTIITFHLVTLAWIFFRSPSFSFALDYIQNMFSSFNPWIITNGSLFDYGISFNAAIVLIVNIVLIFIIEYHQLNEDTQYRKKIRNLHIVIRWIIYFILIYDVILFGAYGSGFSVSSFLYGGF